MYIRVVVRDLHDDCKRAIEAVHTQLCFAKGHDSNIVLFWGVYCSYSFCFVE